MHTDQVLAQIDLNIGVLQWIKADPNLVLRFINTCGVKQRALSTAKLVIVHTISQDLSS